jgi:hypothetical protein
VSQYLLVAGGHKMLVISCSVTKGVWMKKYLCSMGAWIALIALTADGQTSSSGNSQGTSSGTQGASSQGNSQGNVPTTERQNETQPGFQNQQQQPQGFAGQTKAEFRRVPSAPTAKVNCRRAGRARQIECSGRTAVHEAGVRMERTGIRSE